MKRRVPKVSKRIVINLGGSNALLAITFVLLRATETVDWSWVWVLAPLWLPWAVFASAFVAILALLAAVGLVLGFLYFINFLMTKRRR